MRLIVPLIAALALSAPAFAGHACDGEHDCAKCRNCNYCGYCNSGADPKCGVYYASREQTPPWAKATRPAVKKPAAPRRRHRGRAG